MPRVCTLKILLSFVITRNRSTSAAFATEAHPPRLSRNYSVTLCLSVSPTLRFDTSAGHNALPLSVSQVHCMSTSQSLVYSVSRSARVSGEHSSKQVIRTSPSIRRVKAPTTTEIDWKRAGGIRISRSRVTFSSAPSARE